MGASNNVAATATGRLLVSTPRTGDEGINCATAIMTTSVNTILATDAVLTHQQCLVDDDGGGLWGEEAGLLRCWATSMGRLRRCGWGTLMLRLVLHLFGHTQCIIYHPNHVYSAPLDRLKCDAIASNVMHHGIWAIHSDC